MPTHTRAGKVIKVPPPAMELVAPARIDAIKINM
jgi:hypothetical protein